jgi:hypothetical protein
MKAYTYSIYDTITNKYYYGVRKSTTFDLFNTYYTSSKIIKQLIRESELSRFVIKKRKEFDSYEQARLHETKFLKKVNAVTNSRFYNQAISSPRLCKKDSVSEINRRNRISSTMQIKWQDQDYKDNHPFLNITPEEASERGKAGALARAKKYKNGELKKKNTPKTYSIVTIHKNGVTKDIKRNQVPAYRKYGWEIW